MARSIIQGALSEHTGDHLGVSVSPCNRCDTMEEGDRWEWLKLHQGRTHAAQKRVEGIVCLGCFESINN